MLDLLKYNTTYKAFVDGKAEHNAAKALIVKRLVQILL